jgi:hypothetical protein
MACRSEVLVRELMPGTSARDDGLKRTFHGVAHQVIAAGIMAGVKQALAFCGTHARQLLEFEAVHPSMADRGACTYFAQYQRGVLSADGL